MMSEYNRANPFMYITETSQEKMVHKTEDLIRVVIKQFVFTVLAIVCIILQRLITEANGPFVYIVTLILGLGFSYLQLKRAAYESKRDEMNEMILGDHYKDINVNNEQLLTDTMGYYQAIGKVDFAIQATYFFWLMSIVAIIHCVLLLMIHLFS